MAITKRERAITERVIRAREAAGLQKQELGQKLGLSGSGYSPYENFRYAFSVDQLFELSRILKRSVEYFLGIETGLTADEDELLATYRSVPFAEGRQMILRLVKAVVSQD